MISPDLASPPAGPAAPRRGGRPPEAPAPERAFEAFVAAEPGAEPAAAPDAEPEAVVIAVAPEEASDLLTLLDAAAPPAPVAQDAALVLALATVAPAVAVASLREGDEGTSADAEAQVALGAERGPVPAAPAAAPAPTAARPASPLATIAAEAAAAPMVPAEGEADPEPEPATEIARVPSAASAPGVAGGEVRPTTAPAAAPSGFELTAPSATAQSWRLSAAHAEATRAAAREPARAQQASPREVAGQITIAIAQSSQPQLEIRLDPPELGRVQIRLNPTEHGVQALVLADRPETQEFLRRHADVLARDLTDAGYAQVSLDFAAGGEAAPRDAPAEARRFGASFEATPAPAPTPEPPRRTAAGGLDIRL